MAKRKAKKIVKRDLNILKSIQGEFSLRERRVPNKTKYTRKNKHKGSKEY